MMKMIGFFGLLGLSLLFLFACTATSPTPTTIPTAISTNPVSIASTLLVMTPTTTSLPKPTETPVSTKEPASFILAESGLYFAGNRVFKLVDESRAGREIELLIWYPAVRRLDAGGREIVRDSEPDTSDAPYPVILTEENSGRYIYQPHLASYGFIMVVVKSSRSELDIQLGKSELFELVRDFLFSLEQISSDPPQGLEGLLDTSQVGVVGYSYGGDIALMLSGARVDPGFYLSQCAQITSLVPAAFQWIYNDFYCQEARNWDALVERLGEKITRNEDGLWQPITDERIRAVMPMAPTVSWFFGEQGLAAVDRPTFLLWGTKDIDSPYSLEAGYTFNHLTISDRYLISFIGRTHFLPFNEQSVQRLKHFTTAFFGYYLQGHEEYAQYLSENFVTQFEDLAWGVYTGE